MFFPYFFSFTKWIILMVLSCCLFYPEGTFSFCGLISMIEKLLVSSPDSRMGFRLHLVQWRAQLPHGVVALPDRDPGKGGGGSGGGGPAELLSCWCWASQARPRPGLPFPGTSCS